MSDNEEEDFGDDINDCEEEVVIDEDNDDDDFELEDHYDEVQPKVESKKDPEDNIMGDLVKRFNPKSGAAKRLIHDFYEMKKSDPKELGFSTEPKNNDIFNWEVRLFGFDEKSDMASDMKKYKKMTGKDYVEMMVSFPPDYPNIPPFVRVVQPRFVLHTGRVTIGGSLCTDILTMESWNPMYDIQSLMINIFSEIQNGDPRIDFHNNMPYSLEEAKSAYLRVAGDHRWKTSSWMPK